MSVYVRTAIVGLAAVVALSGPAAAGKLVVDPNAQPAPVAVHKADPMDSDKRLDQKVTYSQSRQLVWQAVDDLSTMTGVNLRSGYTLSDWMVRERQMNVFVKDVPLRDLMRSISGTMRFRWEASEHDGSLNYRLVVDTKAIRAFEEDRRKWQENYLKADLKAREALVNRALNLKMASSEERERVRSEEPFCYILEITGINPLLSALIREFPEIRTGIIQGTAAPIEVPVSRLSPSTQGLIRPAADGWQRAQKTRGAHSRYPGPDLDGRLSDAIIHLSISSPKAPIPGSTADSPIHYLASNSSIGALTVSLGNDWYDLVSIESPQSRWPSQSRALISALEGKASFADAVVEEQKMRPDWNPHEDKRLLPDETDRKWLEKKLKLEFRDRDAASIQQALAQASGLNIVSDYFRRTTMRIVFGGGEWFANASGQEKSIENWLCYLRDEFNLDIDKRDNVITLNRHNWYDIRDTQIPQAWIDRWRRDIETHGYLSLENAVEIALLTQGQRDESVEDDPVLAQNWHWGHVHEEDTETARLYSQLGDTEKWALTSGSGIPLALNEAQPWRLYLGNMLRRMGLTADAASGATLTLVKKQCRHGEIGHSFILNGPDGRAINEWEIPGGHLRQ